MNGSRPQAISAQNLTYEVEGKTLLDGVDLQAERGQLVGLIGPNGAGKTTLLRTISGILRYRQGSIHLEGSDLMSMSPKDAAATLALVPQIAPYTYGFTSMELVLMGRYPHLGRFQIEGREDDRIAREAMRLTEIEQFADRTLDTLSGGERQRVFVARALTQQPRILLMDEPTANLDVLHQLKVLDLVRQLVDDGLTAVAAIHDLNMAARYCDKLVLLSGGRVLAEGPPNEVLAPETIESAFGVKSAVYQDPITGSLAISLIGPADEHSQNGTGLRSSAVAERARVPDSHGAKDTA
ncbi:MAG: heme ABC transporter ATP-binding protein [Dehalococcoidia bacterium]|nr:heme ABC transporter ATP-binding protein [Dehalococcoidia bacterium]